jgi:chemotaxis protein histidine kinase CheA
MSTDLTQNLLEELKSSYIDHLPGKLEEIEDLVLQMEKGDFSESYAALYRAIHSLKGSGGTYGFDIITTICHQFEDWLSTLQDVKKVDKKGIDVLLTYVDLLRNSVAHIVRAETSFADIEKNLAELKKSCAKNKLHGLLIDRSPLNAKIVAETLGADNVQLAVATTGIEGLSRLMRESFDFLITSQEVGELSGQATIVALRLSHSVNSRVKTLLLASNAVKDLPDEFQPDIVIKKDAQLTKNLQQSMQLLGLKRP